MAGGNSQGDERAGAEIVYGSQPCDRYTSDLFEELGFPKEILPLQDLEECGRVKETGFVWMKQKAPFQHFDERTKSQVSYAAEITAYTEKFKMKKVSGVKGKQMLFWVPVSEMSIDDPASKKIYFRTPMGIGKSYPVTLFMNEEEKKRLQETGSQN